MNARWNPFRRAEGARMSAAVAPLRDDAPAVEAERGRRLVEESREFVLVLDEEDRVVAASRRARQTPQRS